MPELVPGIHVFCGPAQGQGVDGRDKPWDKPGHDGEKSMVSHIGTALTHVPAKRDALKRPHRGVSALSAASAAASPVR
jgi:hypothetical protein